ncbi:MAG: DUF3108 domain-containing protein, partial [Deltaproteobacteria bacterium]|nr:DUF3108 domain-containing protein [Deltaproteobacteria bacterium]
MVRATISAILVALTLGACGGAAADLAFDAPRVVAADAPAPSLGLFPGEQMSFEVKLGGILIGEASLAVGQPGMVDGHRALAVRSLIATAGAAAMLKRVSDEATTIIDADHATPLTMTSQVTTGGVDYHAEVVFHGGMIDATSTRSDTPRVGHDHFAFGDLIAHDTHTAMAAMRGWEASPGASKTLWVMGGKRIWKSVVNFDGRETIGTQLGNRAAVRYSGLAWRANGALKVDDGKPARDFVVWLSDDADRVPLKVVAKTELGEIIIEL